MRFLSVAAGAGRPRQMCSSRSRRHPASQAPHRLLLVALVFVVAGSAHAADLVSVGVLDKDYLIVHISDGDVVHDEAGAGETILRYEPELDTTEAVDTDNWTITSSDDGTYGLSGLNPSACYRKTKLSGHAEMEWIGGDYRYEYTYEHWIFLQLPSSLQQGAEYTLEIHADTNTDDTSETFTFDIYNSRSEAIHVNLVGYAPDATHKAADLYYWMGNGGARNYSSFEGNTVWVYDVDTEVATAAGTVAFWMSNGSDVFNYNLTRSDVWNVDFASFTSPGTYRLVVEGVGCSQDFEIEHDVYQNPYIVSLRGYYYMRIGDANPLGLSPPPRTPLYIPGVSPPSTVVYLTEMQPWHPEWETFGGGDKWDRRDEWAPYRLPGHPTNPNAWGGYSDAADWDRHLAHVANIWDLLLPYIMTNGAISDDDTGISESGNSIPDIIDSAQWEVDLWLRLRDLDGGYSHGLNNPNGSNVLYQAGATGVAAWANAAQAAMLADAFRIAGMASNMNTYRDAAIAAYNHASGLDAVWLDRGIGLDDGLMRGRDLKMMAAAYLYNVTGDTAWEDVVNAESVCAAGPAPLLTDNRNQLYATAAYLITPRTVNYPTLQANMKTQVIDEAKSEEANLIDSRPSRRGVARDDISFWRTAQNMGRTIVAHAVADAQPDIEHFRKALALEADWGLGRNPLNIVEMSTIHTPLASKRNYEEVYTSGRNDGVPGIHPGHTPYNNLSNWAPGMVMGRPSALYENSYPSNVTTTWPRGETYFPSRWVWAHTEFTPRQTMRGKMALYGYLYGLAGVAPPENPTLSVPNNSVAGGTGTVTSSPTGIDCGGDCSNDYPNGTDVTLTASPDSGSVFAGWTGACFGTEPTCDLTMNHHRAVTATFEPEGLTYTLIVSTDGSGGGVVTSNPAGINCGGDCSEPFLSGTSVELTATANGDSSFSGWSGACSGIGTCDVTMNAARSVTATFRSNTVSEVIIYGDGLGVGWQNWSWGSTIDFDETSRVQVGSNAVNVTLNGWGGFSPARPSGAIDTFGFASVKFWVHGGTGGNKEIEFFTEDAADGGDESTGVDFTAIAGTWTEITITMSDLGDPDAIGRVNFFNDSAGGLGMVTFDHVRLVPDVGIFADGFESGNTTLWGSTKD